MGIETHEYPDTTYGGTASVEVQKDQSGRQTGHMTTHGNGVITDYTDGQYQNGKKVGSATIWDGSSHPDNDKPF